MTSPGVPDLYQGCEQWNFSLVDPDNRRPVDFVKLAGDLERSQALYRNGYPRAEDWHDLNAHMADGRIKQLVTWRLLQLRREKPLLFREGNYLPVPVEGQQAEHALAYVRMQDGLAVLVVAARLSCTLCGGEDSRWSPALWEDTQVVLALETANLRRFRHWRNWLTGAEAPLAADATLDLAALFEGGGGLPFLVLVAQAETA